MLVYNLSVNGYPPIDSEYLPSLLQHITTSPTLFSDDTLRLGTLMLLCLQMTSDPAVLDKVKELSSDATWKDMRSSTDPKVRMLLDDVMVILHRLNQ